MSMIGGVVIVGPAGVTSSCGLVTGWPTEALTNIDDEFALISECPVAVASLWRGIFQPIADRDSALLVFPTWWSDRRVDTVVDAARAAVRDVTVVRRAALLASKAPSRPAIVVEVAESFVTLAVSPDLRPVCAVPMDRDPATTADEIARQVASIGSASVVIDCPDEVAGVVHIATVLADRVRADGRRIFIVDDDQLLRAAEPDEKATDELPAVEIQPGGSWSARAFTVAGTAAALGLAVVAIVAAAGTRSSAPATTLLVEGRVVVAVPTAWTAQRITTGPGSPRLQVNSPTDLQTAVHVTQSAAASGETLQATADTLRRAIDDELPGVFVDFNADDRHGSRPAVTYREIRPGHDIRWTVLIDGGLRISVGCQSARGAEDTVTAVCAQAIASVRDIGELAGTVGAQR